MSPLADRLEAARRELLDTRTRSRLLHTPLDSSRAKIITVVDELADQVFQILVGHGADLVTFDQHAARLAGATLLR